MHGCASPMLLCSWLIFSDNSLCNLYLCCGNEERYFSSHSPSWNLENIFIIFLQTFPERISLKFLGINQLSFLLLSVQKEISFSTSFPLAASIIIQWMSSLSFSVIISEQSTIKFLHRNTLYVLEIKRRFRSRYNRVIDVYVIRSQDKIMVRSPRGCSSCKPLTNYCTILLQYEQQKMKKRSKTIERLRT